MEVAADGRGAATLGAGRTDKSRKGARQKSLRRREELRWTTKGGLKGRTRWVERLSFPSFASCSHPSTSFAHGAT